jgi:hypothetical protein
MAISSGLALALPGPGYPELVYPPYFPFRKQFGVEKATYYSVVVFDVFTSYDSYAGPLAEVRINGNVVGRIPPRGYTQTGGELAPVSFHFQNGFLNGVGPPGRTGNQNFLEIVPGTSYDYLVVGYWRVHYQQVVP